MKIIVQDASALIDLDTCDLLDAWFRLGLETVTTSLVWREINRKHQKTRLKSYVDRGDLRIEPIGAEALTGIVRLRADLPASISLEDASVLFVASVHRTILLTSDRVLRRCAKEHHIEVHGLLWVMDRLVSRGRILPAVAADRLELLCAMGTARLPEKECRQRISKWRNS